MTITHDAQPDAPDAPARATIEVPPPPARQPREGAAGLALNALPMLGSVGSIVLVASLGGASTVTRFLAAGMFAAATLGFVLVQIDRQRRQRRLQVGSARHTYRRQLQQVRRDLRAAARHQRTALERRHPPPAALAGLAGAGSRAWERGRHDADFLHLRHGVGPRPLDAAVVGPDDGVLEDADPASAAAVQRLLEVHRTQPDLPLTIDLRQHEVLALRHGDVRGRARALLAQAVTCHAPAHVRVAVVAASDAVPAWDWVKWLPHAASAVRRDHAGAARLVATSWEELRALLPAGQTPADPGPGADPLPHLLVVVDGVGAGGAGPWDGVPGVTRLVLDPSGAPAAGVADLAETVPEPVTESDVMSRVGAEALARRLAALGSTGATRGNDYLDLLGVALGSRPARPPEPTRPASVGPMCVPIGVSESGDPIALDLKESAEGGMGPHGLVVGATGSGKSEFLRTLVLGLALTHTPEELNLVLVDFKGGATFAGMARLPHTSALITNLADEVALVERAQDALTGELVRRQELLRAAGNLASRQEYEAARAQGAGLEPLPALFIVVDEFSELLAARPEFLDVFGAIGRLGRSLGLHLLLASQRLEEGRLRGLDSHLSYRVGLRTFSAAESRAVLGVPDAHTLPAVPGAGYLKSDPTTLRRFRAAYVSAPRRRASPTTHVGSAGDGAIAPFTVLPGPSEDVPATDPDVEGPSLLEEAIDHLQAAEGRAHRIWLPPLADSPLVGDLAAPRSGASPAPTPCLTVPIGVVDRPRAQRRDLLTVDLSGDGGHLAVVGAARSGTSTLLQTVLAALALRNSPQRLRAYVLDFGGGTFTRWTDLPHLSGVAHRHQPDVVRRLVAEVADLVADRETDQHRAADLRRREEVIVIVDDWGELRAAYDAEADTLQQLAGRALGVGVHLLVGVRRWGDLRMGLRDQFGTRLELRLGDPMDSEVDRRLAAQVPTGRPGRGLTVDREHFLAALPAVSGDAPDRAAAQLIDEVRSRWGAERAPALRLLPEAVRADEVAPVDDGVLLGLCEARLAPVTWDPEQTPHLLVLGDGGSGRTATLRTVARGATQRLGPERLQVVLVDPRRSLLGEVPTDHLLHHLGSGASAEEPLRELAEYLTGRLPGPDLSARQLRERTWWTGADVLVVVDDYDLVAPTGSSLGPGSPLAPLLPLLPQARDVGLHLVVARRSGGAARALHDPVLQTLRDLAMPGLLLSGSPDEGPLLGGVRATPAPPGRGRWVTREDGVRTVQVAWTDPVD